MCRCSAPACCLLEQLEAGLNSAPKEGVGRVSVGQPQGRELLRCSLTILLFALAFFNNSGPCGLGGA